DRCVTRSQGGRGVPARVPHARRCHPARRVSPHTNNKRNESVPLRNSTSGVLFKVLGRRPSVIFGLVTGLVVFLLAAVTVTSRYAMQRYVADQVERVPWDLSIYQTAEVALADKLRDAIAKVDGVERAERLAFLRTIPPYTTRPTIDGQPLRSPWISLLTATEPS